MLKLRIRYLVKPVFFLQCRYRYHRRTTFFCWSNWKQQHKEALTVSMPEQERTTAIPIHKEVQSSFLDYAMSVIVSRALPDIRDGLKPVHRRILYAMRELGMTPDKPHKKIGPPGRGSVGKISPPRWPGCLWCHGAHGPGFYHPLPFGGRPG